MQPVTVSYPFPLLASCPSLSSDWCQLKSLQRPKEVHWQTGIFPRGREKTFSLISPKALDRSPLLNTAHTFLAQLHQSWVEWEVRIGLSPDATNPTQM